jgi:hypothetical protein
MPISPSKSRDLADGNNTILTEWKRFKTTVLERFGLNNRRWQTEESGDEDAPSTSKKPRYDHDFILMNV